MSLAKFEAQVELSCMQSIQWYLIAKGYWKQSRKAEGTINTPQLILGYCTRDLRKLVPQSEHNAKI
jgi:hypothetical protein